MDKNILSLSCTWRMDTSLSASATKTASGGLVPLYIPSSTSASSGHRPISSSIRGNEASPMPPSTVHNPKQSRDWSHASSSSSSWMKIFENEATPATSSVQQGSSTTLSDIKSVPLKQSSHGDHTQSPKRMRNDSPHGMDRDVHDTECEANKTTAASSTTMGEEAKTCVKDTITTLKRIKIYEKVSKYSFFL